MVNYKIVTQKKGIYMTLTSLKKEHSMKAPSQSLKKPRQLKKYNSYSSSSFGSSTGTTFGFDFPLLISLAIFSTFSLSTFAEASFIS